MGPISLTSVDQAGREIGRNAARLLLEPSADRGKPSVQAELSPTLVERRTTVRPSA
ncbi:substrate-binding domain-containing protein [Streptomyces violaceus]|uniref:substrate-binding domain-containing protein n=1 Tax=Streptomyces violaceus TaxID=1936 RepID=UPI0038083055